MCIRARCAGASLTTSQEGGSFRLGIYCQFGNQGKVIKTPGRRYLAYWAGDGPPFDHAWDSTHVLRFMRPGHSHTVEVYWDLDWKLIGWYINLQAPLTIDSARFDTTDWALDLVISPTGQWRWKDEDDLAEALELGLLSDRQAAEVRAEGARVIAARPWPTGWEDWRPPPQWTALPLPTDWDAR